MDKLFRLCFRRGQWRGFLLLSLILLLASVLTSWFPLWANAPLNIILPAFVLLTKPMVMFEKLKLSTLIIMRALILLVIFGAMDGNLYVKIVLAFLVINILEATFTDLLKNKMYFNVVSGLALAASVFFLGAKWVDGVTGPWSGLYNTYITKASAPLFGLSTIAIGATVAWILAYTLWNWCFVMGEFSPQVTWWHIAILGTPLLVSLVTLNPGYWLLVRANSLTFGGVIQISCKKSLEEKFEHPKMTAFVQRFKTPKIQVLCMVVNVALLAWTGVVYFS